MLTFMFRPRQTVEFFKTQLSPVPKIDSSRIPELIANLENQNFDVPSKGKRELEQLGHLAESALRRKLATNPSAEVRRSIEILIERLRVSSSPERLRELRAIEALERIGTPEARALLENLATGATEGFLTRQARSSLDRLVRRSAAEP